MTMSRYDAWKTTAPEERSNACAWCDEPADRGGDGPHALTPDGEGVLCSPLCEACFTLVNDPRPMRRVQALHVALDEGFEREVRLRIATYSHRTGEGEVVVSGYVCDWDDDGLMLAVDGDEVVIGWTRVLDVLAVSA